MSEPSGKGRVLMFRCDCCGYSTPDTRVAGGLMHFRCWDEHHSNPTGAWPRDHVCRKDAA